MRCSRTIKIVILIVILLLKYSAGFAQLKVPFSPRFSARLNGDFVTIGNNVLSTTATGNYTGEDGNHNLTTVFVDIDADATTFNSSSANFTKPVPNTTCVAIKKAYLYWSAADFEEANINNEPSWSYNTAKLMLPGSSIYTTITADNVIFCGRCEPNHFENDPYVCVKDITAQIQALANPYGKYQLANVRAKKGTLNPGHSDGNIGTSGGWQIVFVYESTTAGSTSLPSKFVTIFDGFANVSSTQNNYDITMTGFQTPPTGNISTRVLFGALEGDRDLTGDKFQIKNAANTFVDLSTANRPSNNFFNSRITVEGSDFTDRNPASTNTLGFDAGYFSLNNTSNSIITNNQTSAVFRLTSNQELYGLFLVGFSTDIWAPNLDPLVQVATPSTVNSGDTISYTFTVKDVGNDDARNVTISRILPPEVDLVQPISPLPTGVTYTYNSITRELKFSITDGFVDITDPAINISYKVVVKPQCYFLETACVNSTDAQLMATYSGLKNKDIKTTYSSKTITKCGLGDGKPNTVQINTPPPAVWATTAGALDRIINCNDAQALTAAQALAPVTNMCNFPLIKVSGTFVANSNCPVKGKYTNTWSFTDKCGRISPLFTQVITVQDTTKPVFTGNLPQDITVNCDAIPPVPTLSATDNCGSATVTYADSRTNGQCPNSYILSRTWTAKDVCNNTTVYIQKITVQDTTKPVFTGNLPQDITVNCDAIPPVPTLTATDNCGSATVTYADSRTNGQCPNSYILSRTWTAKDVCNNTTVYIQKISVQDTTKPVFTGNLSQDITVNCDAIPPVPTLTATDNCGSATVTYADSRTNGQCPNSYILSRTWTAKDVCNNTTVYIQKISVQDTTKPVFTDNLPQDITVNCDAIPPVPTLTATDNCGSATVTYADSRTNGQCPNSYILSRTWTAKDVCNNTTVYIQKISVQDTTKPVFTGNLPQDITVNCDAIPPVPTLTATDNCGSATVTYADSRTNGQCANSYILSRTWTAKDVCNNTTVYIQKISVQDTTKPVFTGNLPQDITVNCDAIPPVPTLSATDNCGSATVTYADSRTNGQCPNSYILSRTWTAKDVCNNTTVYIQKITVQDTTKPVFTGNLPQDITVNCDAIPPVPTLSATDNCGVATVTYAERGTEGGCRGNGGIIRTWTAKDACGNEMIHTQTITVQDTTKPEIIGTPQDISVSCGSEVPEASIENVRATDNCSGEVHISVSDAIGEQTCANKYIIIRTWTAKDACGNESSSSQRIEVNDTIRPMFTGDLPQDITVCGNVPEPPALIATDNCGTAEVSFVEVIDSVLNAPYITYTRVWVALDACQNISNHQQTILKSPTIINSITADVCEGKSIEIGEGSYSETGTYVVTLQAQNGCDSIITLHLTKHLAKRTTIDTLICDGERIVIGEHVYTTSVSNEQIVLPASDVCDSIVTLNLRVIICDTIPIGIDTIVYDSIPVLTTDTICNLSLPPSEEIVFTLCNGDSTHGTLPHGTWTLNTQTHCLEYSAGSYTGNDTICISACDPSTRQCNTTTIVITVTGVPPLASDDCVQEIQHNSEISINVLENDVDPDHDRLYISAIITQPKYGIASIVGGEGQSQILYTPNRNFCGRDTLYYEVCDGEDGCDTAMVCLHVNCECVFPQVITPNNDGFNDNLVFPCLSRTADVKLLVWHRWGLIVYEDDNYKNDWQGTFKGGILPAGTYWYSIDYDEPETGKRIHEVNYFMIIN